MKFMAHYDGPPFLRGEAEKPAEKYPLPPKPERQAPKPKPVTPKPKPSAKTEPDIGRHSVDPLAALSTPKSFVRRDTKRPQIDYRVILADMVRDDDQVYLFTSDDNPDFQAPTDEVAPAETPNAEQNEPRGDADNEASEAEVDHVTEELSAKSSETPTDEDIVPVKTGQSDVEQATDAQPVEPDHEPAQPTETLDEAESEPQSTVSNDAQASDPELFAEPAGDPVDEPDSSEAIKPEDTPEAPIEKQPSFAHTSETVTKPTGTKLIPSQVDPLKAAQQAQLEAALAKQKKTVYANWRPIQLPKRNDLHSAVGDYKARHKDLPKPVAQVRADQAQAKADQPQLNQSKAETQAPKPEDAASKPTAPTVEKPVADQKPDFNPDTIALHSETAKPQTPYVFPPLDLLPKPVITTSDAQNDWVEAQSQRLDETLEAFHVGAHVVAHTIGPTVTQFQVSLDAGVKVNKITNLNDDLKLALAAKDIRIEAPIPGKTTVGIEIPNLHPRPVMLREVLQSPAFQDAESPLTIALGVDLFGQPVVTNINKMPHGLIAGATGSGKSVFINSLLTSLLYKATPEQVRLLLIDPKAVELAVYNNLPHLVSPVISDPQAAAEALKWAVEEMENRYQKMAAAGVRNLAQFNRKAKAHGDFGLVLPYIVIIIDELADLMMVAASEVQDYIARITQKARAAGIHLIVATQRPSVDVITGTIKNNIPTRIAFMVASQTDSRTIIDANGAERLLGRGDMLYLGSGASQALRLQGTFIDEDIATVVDFVKKERPAHYLFQPDGLLAQAEASDSQDELFPQVLEYIAQEKHVSTSKLQRVFSIGYNRAANLIDELEMRHYISPANGSKPRDVYFTKEDLADD
ncbi:cell division protein dna segregation atpase ftsk spoiiie-like protein [Lacticaseibacillus manihotivorans DSM 13343 = JCM 12514]|jgi:S-DNA-T family DNA segregation ATPase FtsK/SpoIIIE|uniref:DNA translocase FtsK n=2 Tax=Lacticaseibacillus manihotivorans TaxID=88233 RepID=A0A0R1QUN3_9LACO|nr:cell division protein dna segregation atpase ftsk spoiiie-like protein [Lacticaseibacillus manihotivorans DSM 13343 = JCM 12514]